MSENIQAFTNQAFTEEQRSAIHKYIDRLDKINIYSWP